MVPANMKPTGHATLCTNANRQQLRGRLEEDNVMAVGSVKRAYFR